MISIEDIMGNALKAAGLGLLLGSGACLTTDPVDPNKQTVAVVSGRVIRGDGKGVGEPSITIQLLGEASGGSARVIATVSGFGLADGRFVQPFFINGFLPQTGSARISVVAPLGSGLAGRDTSGIPVRLTLSPQAADTAYVQITLLPR